MRTEQCPDDWSSRGRNFNSAIGAPIAAQRRDESLCAARACPKRGGARGGQSEDAREAPGAAATHYNVLQCALINFDRHWGRVFLSRGILH